MLRVSSIQVSQTSPLPFHAEARKWLRADSHLGPPSEAYSIGRSLKGEFTPNCRIRTS